MRFARNRTFDLITYPSNNKWKREGEMKVILFCGGLGMRLRDYSEDIPKPMVPIGYRPILWHVMKYYAHFGHKDFILCLGYKADVIKNYFLNYNECLSNNFVLTGGGKEVRLLNSDIDDWRITFVDTGLISNIGQRSELNNWCDSCRRTSSSSAVMARGSSPRRSNTSIS